MAPPPIGCLALPVLAIELTSALFFPLFQIPVVRAVFAIVPHVIVPMITIVVTAFLSLHRSRDQKHRAQNQTT